MKKKYSRVYVEITNICNRSCSFCPGTRRAPMMMELGDFTRIAQALRPLTDYLYFHVMGEPLLHPQLCDFIRLASDMGFKCAVTTNGTLLADRADELIGSGVYKVNISVHSFEEGGEAEQCIYLSRIADFADRASSAGILTVLRLWNVGSDGGKNDFTLSLLKDRFAHTWTEGARGFRLRHKLHIEYGERFEWPDMQADDMGNEVFCYGLSDHFGILCDGSVVPCCLDREGEITLGNILTDDINRVLTSRRATALAEGLKCRRTTEELCRKCGYARRFG